MSLAILEEELAKVKIPKDLFGLLTGDKKDKLEQLKRLHRILARSTHPDRYGLEDRDKAGQLTAFINVMYDKAIELVEADKYDLSVEPFVVTTKRHRFEIFEETSVNGVATSHRCTTDGIEGWIHIPINAADNDLMEAETTSLKTLLGDELGVGYHLMVPKLIQSINISGKKCNVFETRKGDFITFAEVMAARPDGVDPRDLAWMFRRLLDLLGYIHHHEIVSAAITPDNVFIGTGDTHDVVLHGWQYSVPIKNVVKAINPTYRDLYPNEILDKRIVSPATDIYMAAKMFAGALPDNCPKVFRGWLKACLVPQSGRPQNAWKFRQDFTVMVDSLFGRREYRPFIV